MRARRAELNMLQSDLKEATGVSMRAISAIENNKPISEENIESLLRFFGLTAAVSIEFTEITSKEEEE